jgi:hypothetical protein
MGQKLTIFKIVLSPTFPTVFSYSVFCTPFLCMMNIFWLTPAVEPRAASDKQAVKHRATELTACLSVSIDGQFAMILFAIDTTIFRLFLFNKSRF